MTPTPEESAFDEHLRSRLTDLRSPRPLPAGGLADVRARIAAASAPPAPPSRTRPFAAGIIVGILLMLIGWWGGRQFKPSAAVPAVAEVHNRQPETYKPQVDTYNRQPDTYNRQPDTYNRQPDTYNRQPDTYNRLADTRKRQPDTYNRQLDTRKRQPDSYNPQPDTRTSLPDTRTSPPVTAFTSSIITSASSPDTASGPAVTRADSVKQEADPSTSAALPARWARVIALDTAIHHAASQPVADTTRAAEAARRAHLRALLDAQTAALATIQASVDSLKASLSEAPPQLPTVLALADSARPDSAAWRHLPPPRSPWALLALLETTPRWSMPGVPDAASETERTQASLSQSIQLQRQIGSRWLVRAGFGQLATQTQVNRTSERISSSTVLDSTLIVDLIVRNSISTSQIIRIDSILHAEPIVNLSGQIIGYDTTWLPTHDTLLVPIITYDTLRNITKVYTSRTEMLRSSYKQLFRPKYRFWILPISTQYQLLRTNRWTIGLNLGAQLTIFRSGERPVWNGNEYFLRRVSASESPYHAVSLSVSTGFEATYRLSPRLSALLAPTGRWWVISTSRNTATQRLLPALQAGVTCGF